jgi:LPS sulfotransferase NodH
MIGEWKRRVPRPPLGINVEAGKIPFVVLAYQRTGSNMLVRNHLNKHPAVHMHFELYNEKAIYTQSRPGETHGANRDLDAIRARDKDPAGFLERTIRESPTPAVGFKFFPEHARDADFLDRLLADHRIRKVILRRENRLACLTSIVRASVTGSYINASLDKVRVHISPSDFQSWIRGYDQYYAFLRDRLTGQEFVEITYESLVANPSSTLQPIFGLLGLPPQLNARALPGDLRPQSSGKLSQAVANYDTLREAFAFTNRERDFN